MKKTGIFMPARLSSERLPNKLILPIGKTCLFDIACKKLNSLNENINKYVLINDEELISIARKYENLQIVIRDEKTCKVDGPLTYIFKDIEWVSDDYLMFLNPCLLMLSKETIETAIDIFNNSSKEYATSVKEFTNWVLNVNGSVLNDIDYDRLTTKEIKGLYEFAHCFHIFNKNEFFKDGMMLKDGFLPIVIPEEETVDVDTRHDYNIAKYLYEQYNR